jgi:uncharacterized protein (DUF924 family)
MVPPAAEEVLLFWFGELREDGRAAPEKVARWFRKDPAFDAEIRARFERLHEAVAAGEREGWLATRRGRLAYVIVLDQLSRNMYRDTARAFASDPQALRAARDGIAAGDDRALAFAERDFLYMPFMHAEDVAEQDRCVELFSRFRDELSGELRAAVEHSLSFAVRHRDIVARFGRFPHRNAVLGRASTPEEQTFLQQPGSGF